MGCVSYFPPGSKASYPSDSFSEVWPSDWGAFRLLAVDPAARGLGVGRLLTDSCIDRAAFGRREVPWGSIRQLRWVSRALCTSGWASSGFPATISAPGLRCSWRPTDFGWSRSRRCHLVVITHSAPLQSRKRSIRSRQSSRQLASSICRRGCSPARRDRCREVVELAVAVVVLDVLPPARADRHVSRIAGLGLDEHGPSDLALRVREVRTQGHPIQLVAVARLVRPRDRAIVAVRSRLLVFSFTFGALGDPGPRTISGTFDDSS